MQERKNHIKKQNNMKKGPLSFFSVLWKRKPETTTPVVLNVYSQPHVLQQRMKEEKLSHGDRIKANISPVRLENWNDKVVMYFCPLDKIDVKLITETGDGGPIPDEATLKGFVVPKDIKPGLYTLNGVELFSNGTMQVIAGKDTVLEPLGNPIPDVGGYTYSEQRRSEYLIYQDVLGALVASRYPE